MESSSALPVPRSRLTFAYDSQGRRFRKTSYSGSAILGWTLESDSLFLYDGFEQLCELRTDHVRGPASTTILAHLRGEGLPLATISTQAGESTTRLFCLDGNRNVVAQVDAATALSVAHYDYSPFGLPVAATGPAAQDNHLRFSSEAFDPETGLVYYNYRYYSPELGRWLSRDPLGEQGGANLYAMLDNDAIQNVDRLGLFKEGRRRYRLRVQREGLFMHIGSLDCPGCPICTYTGTPHKFDLHERVYYIGAALDAVVAAFPQGHSDFTGDIHGPDGIFDYNIEDDSFHTHPATPWGIHGHFVTTQLPFWLCA